MLLRQDVVGGSVFGHSLEDAFGAYRARSSVRFYAGRWLAISRTARWVGPVIRRAFCARAGQGGPGLVGSTRSPTAHPPAPS